MIYLLESDISENSLVSIGLTNVYGIGKNRSFLICKKLGFSFNLKIKNLTEIQINQIIKHVSSLKFVIANDLKRLNLINKQKLISIKSYKGLRKKKGFPVRGQRTHTNAKTAKKIR